MAGKGTRGICVALAAFGCCLAIAGGASAGAGPTERIVGGDVADPADWPFIAAVADKRGNQFCGGSVVDSDSIVTAAHCVVGEKPKNVHIITGRPDLGDEGDGEEIHSAEIKVHRQYLRSGARDVAVVNLKDPTSAPAIDLATTADEAAETAPGSALRVAGWGGTTPTGGNPSDVLLDVAVFAISDSDCDEHFGFFRPSEEVCAFGDEVIGEEYDYNDSCFGDSGGPLVADTPGDPLLVGLVSYGGNKCGVQKPGVYQQIGINRNWIYNKANTP